MEDQQKNLLIAVALTVLIMIGYASKLTRCRVALDAGGGGLSSACCCSGGGGGGGGGGEAAAAGGRPRGRGPRGAVAGAGSPSPGFYSIGGNQSAASLMPSRSEK